MAVLKIRRGLEANRSAFTPVDGEILCASDTRVLYLGDGSTAGGNIVRADAITFNGQLPSDFATAAQGTKADTAYGWGDHSLAGYQLASAMPDALSDFTNDVGFITGYTVTQADVVAHQAALTLTKSQISDLETYEPGDIEGLQEALDAKLDLAGGTMTGALNLSPSSAGGAGLNLGEGTAPSAPVNGDVWVTTTNIQVRVNGTTRTLAYTNSWSTVSQAEAEAGTATSTRLWTAQRVNQAIKALAPVKADGTGAAGTWGIDISGNAATATKLTTARIISLTGDVTGSVAFDGSANVSITATVQDDSHNHTISNVDGLQTALDGKQPLSSVLTNTTASFTTALKNIIDGLGAASTRAVASIANIWQGSGTGLVSSEAIAGSSAWVTLTDAATVTVNGTAFISGKLTITDDRTLGNMTDPIPGRVYQIYVKSDSSTPRTLTLDTKYVAMGGLDLTGITNTTGGRLLLTIVQSPDGDLLVSGGRF